MEDKKVTTTKSEQGFSKQIEEIDKRIDRGGMISLILIVVAIFVIGYWTIDFLSLTDDHSTLNSEETVELYDRIEQLESRIAKLENAE